MNKEIKKKITINTDILWNNLDLELRKEFLSNLTGEIDSRLDFFVGLQKRLKNLVLNFENGVLRTR